MGAKTRAGDHAYRFGLSLATLLIAEQLAENESDEERRQRKQMVITDKWALLRDTFRAELDELHGYGGTGPSVRQLTTIFAQTTAGWPADQRQLLLIDLITADAFAPYELKVSAGDLREAIGHIAAGLVLSDSYSAALFAAWDDALRAYRPSRWKQVMAPGGTLTPVLATGGPDPATASALISSAGLTNGAATTHGIALLGGGSFAVGGAGMAGGLWLVTTTTGESRGPLPGGGFGVLRLGQTQLRSELVKLQLSYRMVVLGDGTPIASADDVRDALARIHDELRQHLEAERRLNDDDAQRIRDVESTLQAVDIARSSVDGVEAQAA